MFQRLSNMSKRLPTRGLEEFVDTSRVSSTAVTYGIDSRRSGLEGVRAGEKELRGPPQALVRPAEGEKRSSHRTIRCSAKKRPMAASRETGQGMMNVCAVGVAIIAFL